MQEIISGPPIVGVDATQLIPSWLREEETFNPLNVAKRKRFIRLLCKVKGEPEYDESKEVKENIKITIEDVQLVVKKVAGVDLIITEE